MIEKFKVLFKMGHHGDFENQELPLFTYVSPIDLQHSTYANDANHYIYELHSIIIGQTSKRFLFELSLVVQKKKY